MSDLILRIHFNESRKKNHIILETFQGKIPNLKSNQFSGQLRKVDINTIMQFDNLSDIDFQRIKNFLNNNRNQKIGRNIYIIYGDLISAFNWIKDFDCLFYMNKDKTMYKVLQFTNEKRDDILYNIEENYMYYYDKTFLNIYDKKKNETKFDNSDINITPIMYLDLSNKKAIAYLEFDYDGHIINYNEKDIYLDKLDAFRDYGYEEKIINILKSSGWHLKRNGELIFDGKDIYDSIDIIVNNNIKIYNKTGMKISTSKFENVNISYDIDWFNISGEFDIEGRSYGMDEIISAMNNRSKWIEIDGNCIVLKKQELETLKKIQSKDNRIGFSRKHFIDAMNIADNKKIHISNIEKLFNSDYNITVPDMLWNKLRDYQRKGVEWLCERCNSGFGVCLADDMGLGKTLQVIAFLSQKQWENSQNIVIVPMTLLENWNREIKKFSPELKIKVYHGPERNLKDIESYNIILTTYGTCLNDIKILEGIRFGCLVVDEAQYIKNNKSKTYKAIMNIKADSKILLTGTPMENNLMEYWSLMQILNPNYLPPYIKINKLVDDDEKKLVTLIKKVTSPFILRRMKTDVLKELPEKTEQIIYCEFEERQYNLYRSIQDSVRDYIKSENEAHIIKQSSVYILTGLLRLRQICCDPRLLPKEINPRGISESGKTSLALNMITDLIYNNHKVVLYSDFPPLLKILYDELKKKNIATFYIDGETNARQDVVDKFEKTNNAVFLISLKAGGTGLNLVSADTAIIYNPWWNPAAEKQAEDRIYRIGQKQKVTIYKLIMANSIEEKMLELKNKKSDISAQLLEGAEGISKLTIDEIKKMIF